MRFLLLTLLLAGCVSNPVNPGTVPATEEGQQIKFDRRLLEKCPKFDKKLTSGSDEEVVSWSEAVLKNASDCRKAQHSLVDEVKKMFKIQ